MTDTCKHKKTTVVLNEDEQITGGQCDDCKDVVLFDMPYGKDKKMPGHAMLPFLMWKGYGEDEAKNIVFQNEGTEKKTKVVGVLS